MSRIMRRHEVGRVAAVVGRSERQLVHLPLLLLLLMPRLLLPTAVFAARSLEPRIPEAVPRPLLLLLLPRLTHVLLALMMMPLFLLRLLIPSRRWLWRSARVRSGHTPKVSAVAPVKTLYFCHRGVHYLCA